MVKWAVVLGVLFTNNKTIFAEDTSQNFPPSGSINLWEVFQASPTIYCLLLALSLFAVSLWLYSMFTLSVKKILPTDFTDEIENYLKTKNFDLALNNCESSLFSGAELLLQGLLQKNLGKSSVSDAITKEGKRFGVRLWQRLSLLNDVIIISPMLGLLGTVIGMFYAFYDVNRSVDSLTAIFDGLGIAVGTTVAGLIVALLALFMHATLKIRIIRTLDELEKTSLSLIRYFD